MTNRPFSNAKDIIEAYGINHGETDKAVLIDFGNVDCWLPKSQLEDWPDKGKAGDVLMPEWLAKEKEII